MSRRSGSDEPSRDEAVVLGFPSYRGPARRLAASAGIPYRDIDIHRFPDGESRVRLPGALPPDVIFCQTLNDPNRKLVELEIAAAAATELGARRLTLVAPYLCYMRQDKAFQPGEAVSQGIIGALLARRFDTVITVDPHLHRVHDLREAVPARRAVAVTAAPLMAQWLAARKDHPLLIGPDAESRQWVEAIAAPGGLAYGVARKERAGDRDVSITLPDLPVAGRPVVLVDDVASTGRTLATAADLLREAGAASIGVLVTHALFVGDAEAELRAAGVGEIFSTDSVEHPSNRLRLDALLAEALANG
jgi:ribose-phosphate pyrophosphokinase